MKKNKRRRSESAPGDAKRSEESVAMAARLLAELFYRQVKAERDQRGRKKR